MVRHVQECPKRLLKHIYLKNCWSCEVDYIRDPFSCDLFSNIISTHIISGNLIMLSDHNRSNYFEHDWSNFNQDYFLLDYFSFDWKNIINLQKIMLTTLFKVSLIQWIIYLKYMHVIKSLKNANLNSKKNHVLVWVYKNLFQWKTQFSRNILIKKDPYIKEELYQKYNLNYGNIIATLMKKGKQNYFTKYFESNVKNLNVGLSPSKKIVLFASMKGLWKWWKMLFNSS